MSKEKNKKVIETASNIADRVFDTLGIVIQGGFLVGSAVYLDFMIMVAWEKLTKKDQIFWAIGFCGLPTIAVNALVIYIAERSLKSVVKNTKESIKKRKNKKNKVEDTEPSSRYFSVIENGCERKIGFEEVIKIDLTDSNELEEPSSLTVQFQGKYDPLAKEYEPKNLIINFTSGQCTVQVPWGIQSYLVDRKGSLRVHKQRLVAGFSRENFDIEQDTKGTYYWRFEDTPIHFAPNLRTLYYLKNGVLEPLANFDEGLGDREQLISVFPSVSPKQP